ncbi:hypothetical protein F4778DRAFT_635009 [Xylariomycetidae sp. FL2044]|nr:hypothetical protein F4778DRAFT_635009 [Xylariomycetidae sp. FL2044]
MHGTTQNMKRIRFAGDGSTGNSQKRRQVRRACDMCRKGKRACKHVLDHPEDLSGPTDEDQTPYPVPSGFQGLPALPSLPTDLGRLSRAQPASALTATFSGPSSARSLLLSAFGDRLVRENVLSEDQLPQSRLLRPSLQDIRAPSSERRPGVGPGYLPMVVRAVLPYLEIECLKNLPPEEDIKSLKEIFMAEISGMLPIVYFREDPTERPINQDVPGTIMLRQAICLAASKSASATPFLRLPQEDEDGRFVLHSPREFADRLFGSLKIGLDIGLVDDRMRLIQVLALMTFHSYGPDGDDEVSRLCGQAVHYAYSLGLHRSPRADERYPLQDTSERRRIEVICSLFALDKIVSMITGRPAHMYECDIALPAVDDHESWKTQHRASHILHKLCRMLDRVLGLYRPGASAETHAWEESWPEFESLVRGCDQSYTPGLSPHTESCLEVLYHTISVLSCPPDKPSRPSSSTANTEGRDSSSANLHRTRSQELRVRYSAEQIPLLLGMCDTGFLFVPYAAFLSAQVALRTLQDTCLETVRRRARTTIETNLEILDSLAERFWHAESAGRLGHQTFRKIKTQVAADASDLPRRNSPSMLFSHRIES